MNTLKSVAVYSPNGPLHSNPLRDRAHARVECLACSGLENKTRVPTLTAGANDLIEDGLPDTATKKGRAGAH